MDMTLSFLLHILQVYVNTCTYIERTLCGRWRMLIGKRHYIKILYKLEKDMSETGHLMISQIKIVQEPIIRAY